MQILRRSFIYFFTAISMLGFFSCKKLSEFSPDSSWPEKPQDPRWVYFRMLEPLKYSNSDLGCTKEKALKDLSIVQMSLAKESITADLSLISGVGLSAPFIKTAYYSKRVEKKYTGCIEKEANQAYLCENEKRVDQNPKDLKIIHICKRGPFELESIENQALVAAFAIKSTYQLVKELNLPPILLYLNTEIEKSVRLEGKKDIKEVLSDNAYFEYLSAHANSYTIYTLPQSRHAYERGYTPLNLQPAVLSHEFGHHIFFVKTSKVFFEDQAIHSSERKVNLSLIFNAFEEGFADLMAKYSYPHGSKLGVVEANRFILARDVASEINDDKQAKVLNSSVLRHFLSSKVSYPDHYLTPDHQDVHTIGAIIAHTLDLILTIKHQENQKAKAMDLIQVAEKLEKLYISTKYDKPKDFLEDILEMTASSLVNSMNLKDLVKSCEVVKKNFPVFYTMWELKDDFVCFKK